MYSFIVNPNSRSGEGRNVWNRLRSIMESQGISYQYFLTEYVGHATVLAQRISAAGTPEDPVTLVTVGGDGTIYEVLTGIIDLSSVVFGFIPVGSGNDFCRSMGLPFDPFEALRSLKTDGPFSWMFLFSTLAAIPTVSASVQEWATMRQSVRKS